MKKLKNGSKILLRKMGILRYPFEMSRNLKNLWLKYLLNESYEQGEGGLMKEEDGQEKFCCLGVLAELVYVDSERLKDQVFIEKDLIFNDYKDEMKQLIGNQGLPHILSRLNDGAAIHASSIEKVNTQEVILNNYTSFKDAIKNRKRIKYTFKEIATFIQNNVKGVPL